MPEILNPTPEEMQQALSDEALLIFQMIGQLTIVPEWYQEYTNLPTDTPDFESAIENLYHKAFPSDEDQTPT